MSGSVHEDSRETGDVRFDLVDRCVAIARAKTNDARAWELTKLGYALGAVHEFDKAIEVLDAAYSVAVSDSARVGALTCAVEVHVESGDVETAQLIALPLHQYEDDVDVLETLARLYRASYLRTENPEMHHEWQRCNEQLAALGLPVV